MSEEISESSNTESTKPTVMTKKKVTIRKTSTATTKKRSTGKKEKTTILNTKELKDLLSDVVDPVRIAESVTGVNVVDELIDNKKSITNLKVDGPNINKSFLKDYLEERSKMTRDVFIHPVIKPTVEEELFGTAIKVNHLKSGRQMEVNSRSF